MANQHLRIVSLLPGATEILAALGLAEFIVGRSHECDYPPEIADRPVCTQTRLNSSATSAQIHNDVSQLLQSALSIYQIKTDVLEQLQPTHILTQDQCDVCAVSLKDVEQAVATLTHSQPQVISLHPNVLTDIWADIKRVGEATEIESRRLLESLQARINICQQKTQALSTEERPTVACIEWTDPLMSAANWVPELVTFAGGKPLFGIPGQPSLRLSWETLVATNPDIIVFMPCGLDLNRTRQEAMLLTQRPEWQDLQATQAGRVYVTDGNSYFNRPGPRVADSQEILAEILHPEIFPPYGYMGAGWEQLVV
ncbi:MAG: cobalamin-binding protein [Chroococcidiopsidaceae cyanobacterium CP_BM_RX_35]|nr:cobalamin-binding protein [Chroococcidiopsidaceae cyanobacterium CP_BM_RX_35]